METIFEIFENQEITEETILLYRKALVHSRATITSNKIILAINCNLIVKNNPSYTSLPVNVPGVECGCYHGFIIVALTGISYQDFKDKKNG